MFYFYELVVYAEPDETKFPENPERLGFFLGVAKNVGHDMTFILQKADNLQVITRSAVRRLKDHPNPRAVTPQSAVPLVTGTSTPDSVTVNPPTTSVCPPSPSDVEDVTTVNVETSNELEPDDDELHALEQEGLNAISGEVYYAVTSISNHCFSTKS